MGRSEAPDVVKASAVARDSNKPQIAASISKPCAACGRLKNDMGQPGRFSEALYVQANDSAEESLVEQEPLAPALADPTVR